MHPERGFTLVEMLVALTVGALVTLLGYQVFASVADNGRAVSHAAAALDRRSNARRWLTAAFLSVEVAQDSTQSFDGGRDRVTFTAWQQTADGWFERQRIALERVGGSLVARPQLGNQITLMDSVREVAWDYLLAPGVESQWGREWTSPLSAPLAVRLRVTRQTVTDTLLFLIRERG